MIAVSGILMLFYLVLLVATAALSALNFAPFLAAVLLLLMLSLLLSLMPMLLAWDRNNFGSVIWMQVFHIAFSICIYAGFYYQRGILKSGEIIEPTVSQAIYFSVTTWTTLGYGDYSPIDNLKLLTSIEALSGYLGMGVFVAVVAVWMNEALHKSDSYISRLDGKHLDDD